MWEMLKRRLMVAFLMLMSLTGCSVVGDVGRSLQDAIRDFTRNIRW
jgi:hypothetical protein